MHATLQHGPSSPLHGQSAVAFSSKPRRRFLRELAALGLARGPGPDAIVGEAELAVLPRPVQRYLHFMGVVGRPRDWSFRAGWTGQFRRGPNEPWIPCEAWQYNSALDVARIFYMRLTLKGVLPTVVRDTYLHGRGRMLAKAFDAIKVVDGSGFEIDTDELVTFLNDAVLYAPSMILCPQTAWAGVDEGAFDVKFTDAGRTVAARVFIDERGAPYDFSTTDRFVTDPYTKGHPLVRAQWTTPIDGWRSVDGRFLPSGGRAVWHLPGGTFDYAKFVSLDGSLVFNVPPGG